jgi:N-acetylglucosamine kinase-like BadF-type ATPase
LIGGWGYLIGDEGGGYWLGSQALRALVRAADGRGRDTILLDRLMSTLNLSQPLDVIGWLYGDDGPRVREVAILAPLVLECDAEGDAVASRIVRNAAFELALSARTVRHRLGLHDQQPAFAGSLLTSPNPLSLLVCELLGLDSIPAPKYPPVIGAALLGLNAV